MIQGKATAFQMRVVSYNVLSSHLATASHYSTYNPDHLLASNRLPLVLEKLDEELKQNQKVVVCLQEVSYDWAGAFHVFFAKRGYHMVTGLYGRPFNGYMGVAMAWPTETLETVDVDISRLSDTREGGWPTDPEVSTLERLWKGLQSYLVEPTLQFAGVSTKNEEPIDPWSHSKRRFNVLLTATLQDKASGVRFCVGNYHMPCAFYAPPVMALHSEMAARHVQRIAEQQGKVAYIVAGDWNLKPTDSVYQMLTTGTLDPQDPAYPAPSQSGMEWKVTLEPMTSAYAASGQGEPAFTNYARAKEETPFVDTLDFIFLSKTSWKVQSVKSLPKSVEESGGPFPNLDAKEPSDHLLIAATLEYVGKVE